MRVAALAFGVLAGLVASLVLALGGLDVSDGMSGDAAQRQAQAIRFGLLLVGNLGIFGAGLVLASPIAGGIFLLLGAAAWVGAALLTQHSTDFVLYTPPALLLIGAVFAFIARFRRPTAVDDSEPDIEIMPPPRAAPMPSAMMDADDIEEDVGMPAFAAEPQAAARSVDDEASRAGGIDWNPRKRPPPPPRTKPAFRSIEEEYEDDEPSGFSRFVLGASGVLSFGLYAGLAGAALLVFWTLRDRDTGQPAAVVAEIPEISSSAAPSSEPLPTTPVPAVSLEPPEATDPSPSEPILRDVTQRPTASPSEVQIASAEPPDAFGDVVLSSDPTVPPSLASTAPAEATPSAEPPTALIPSAEAPAPPSEQPVPEPVEVAQATPPLTPSVAAPGQPFPRALPLDIVVARERPALGAVTVATPLVPAVDPGL